MSKWAGESEQALRALFHEAAAAQPSVLFLDELDALAGGEEGRQSKMGGKRPVVLPLLHSLLSLSTGPSRSDAAAPGGDASTRRLLAELLLLLGDAATGARRSLLLQSGGVCWLRAGRGS